MPLSAAVFKGSGVSLISKINKEMQIRCSKKCFVSLSRALGVGRRQLSVLGSAGEGRVSYSGDSGESSAVDTQQRLCLQGY